MLDERRQQDAFAQAADLVVDRPRHPVGLQDPVAGHFLLRREVAPGIRADDGLVILEHGLEAEVVVHAAIGQRRPCREW
jgi:hypothetical protein